LKEVVESAALLPGDGIALAIPVRLLLPLLVFAALIGGLYMTISRPISRREGLAVIIAILAALPFFRGATLLIAEYGRWQHGRVSPGVVIGKLSSTGEGGSQTIGGSRRWRHPRRMPSIVTSRGFQYDDVLARVILTGSTDAWVVEYRAPCESAPGCHRREFVSHDQWTALHIGQVINVRTGDELDSGRLDDNPMWTTGLALTGIGAVLGIGAGLVSGRWLPRRTRYETAAGVVLGVEAVRSGEWRVRFAYLSADGTAYESASHIYVEGVKPGDDCLAVYPQANPDLGTLRLLKA
jgi:hypothetical protein